MEPLLKAGVRACTSTAKGWDADHQRISNAVFARDPGEAGAEMVRHMIHIREAISLLFNTAIIGQRSDLPACSQPAEGGASEGRLPPSGAVSLFVCEGR
jgi:hypothetical protein